MPDLVPVSGANEPALQAEIARQNKIIQALMNRAERNASVQGSDFNLFHTAITLEDQVRRRTDELEVASRENEKITRALRESENRNRLLVENSPMSIHEIGMDGRITSMNRAGLHMLGFKEENEVQGSLYLDAVNDADRKRIGELLTKAYVGETSHFEFKASGPRGQIYKSCFVPIKNANGSVEKLMGITEDITERKNAEEQIHNLAFYDPLTKLPNRRLLNDRLTQVMAASKRSGCYAALMLLDLDNFKPVNDMHGHNAGDMLLVEVADRLKRCVRETDTVARFGGDEFVVLVSELDTGKAHSMAQAGTVAEKIRATLAKPYFLRLQQEANAETTVEHHCTSSIGVALFPANDATKEDMLKWADIAMYQAKEAGRNRIHFHEP